MKKTILLFAFTFFSIISFAQFKSSSGNKASAPSNDKFMALNFQLMGDQDTYFVTLKNDTIVGKLFDYGSKGYLKFFTGIISEYHVLVGNEALIIKIKDLKEGLIPVKFRDQESTDTFQPYMGQNKFTKKDNGWKYYVYYKNVVIKEEKGDENLFLPLVNAQYANKIPVYGNPAALTRTVNGSEPFPNSVYIIQDNYGLKLSSKNYKDLFEKLYDGCPHLLNAKSFMKSYPSIQSHMYSYNTNQCD